MIIPSVAIHMNRAANDGVKLLANVDTFPLLGCGAQDLRAIVAEAEGVAPEQILGHDLFLYLRGRGSVLGAEGELIGSPKLDDLACAFALTEGFCRAVRRVRSRYWRYLTTKRSAVRRSQARPAISCATRSAA